MSSELPDSALPGLFQETDAASVVAQRRFLLASRARLLLLIAAAATGPLAVRAGLGVDLAAAGIAASLSGALAVEVWLVAGHQERTWYDGRALAESAKTLAWRYAVAGAPFAASMTGDAAERRLVDLLAALVRDAPRSGLGSGALPQVTAPMRQLRAAELERRRRAYLAERVEAQGRWYGTKARWNQARASRWRAAVVASEAAGVLLAVLRPAGDLQIDLAGVVAAAAAAAVAWLSLKQHTTLSRAYTFAANDLAMARTRLGSVTDETGWSVEVDNAERAISREHTLWRAFRSAP